MKKIIGLLLTLSLTLIAITVSPKVEAVTITSAPYNTYTIGPEGMLVVTQTAYEPAGTIGLQTTLNEPQDMYIKDDILYVADTENKRVIKIYEDGQFEELVTNLITPTGVHVDEKDQLYVVDKGAQAIYVYDENLNLKLTITRPQEPIFGLNTPFIPLKITTGPRGIMYVTGEGSVSGVMQFNHAGEFLGFLGTNPTERSFYREVLEFFNVPLAPITPISPENVAVDAKGSLYTTSQTETDQVKKFNIASQIVFSISKIREGANPTAVFVNDFGNIYSVTPDGVIMEHDANGHLLFMFGRVAGQNPVLGLFEHASDIVVDSNYNIYVLDQTAGNIQILQRSEFTALVHQGLQSLQNGQYNVEEWENVLRMNSVFALANSVIARIYYRTGEYDTALNYYRIAYDKEGYSEVFWQVRNNFLTQSLGVVFLLLIILFVLRYSLRLVDHKWHIYDPIRTLNKKANEVKTIRELRLGLRVFRHPLDTFHIIKHEKASSIPTALIFFALFLILNVVAVYATGFLYNNNDLESYNIFSSFLGLGAFILLFIFANYLIATLSSGEGWFKDVLIGTAYALVPYIILTVPIILLSHVLTLNESFIYTTLLAIRDGWVIVLLLLMIFEIHNFSVGELIKNVLLTIFTMIIIVAVLLLVYLLVLQMWDYIVSIFKEVIGRVSS